MSEGVRHEDITCRPAGGRVYRSQQFQRALPEVDGNDAAMNFGRSCDRRRKGVVVSDAEGVISEPDDPRRDGFSYGAQLIASRRLGGRWSLSVAA